MYVPSFISIKRGSDGGPLLKILQGASICSKNGEYQYFDVCSPDPSSCANKPILRRCKLVIQVCMCQVSLGLRKVQMGAHHFKYNKVALLARKTGNINTSMSAAPKLALVPASRYDCDVKWSYHNVCAKFH